MKKYIFLMLLAVLTMASCSTTKNAAGTAAFTPVYYTADMKVSLVNGGSSRSVPGSFHMMQDSIIRMQAFVPILGSELVRAEFTPSHVLLIDRINRQYFKERYSDVDVLAENGITFNMIQQLVLDELKKSKGQKKVSRTVDLPAGLLGQESGSISVVFSNINDNPEWEKTTQISSKYKKINANALMKNLPKF